MAALAGRHRQQGGDLTVYGGVRLVRGKPPQKNRCSNGLNASGYSLVRTSSSKGPLLVNTPRRPPRWRASSPITSGSGRNALRQAVSRCSSESAWPVMRRICTRMACGVAVAPGIAVGAEPRLPQQLIDPAGRQAEALAQPVQPVLVVKAEQPPPRSTSSTRVRPPSTAPP